MHPSLTRDIDPLAVEEYFAYGYVPEPRTIFKRAHKLPPGFTLTLKRGVSPRAAEAILGHAFHAGGR